MIDPFYSKNVVDVPVSDIETYQLSTPRQLDHPGTAMTGRAESPSTWKQDVVMFADLCPWHV